MPESLPESLVVDTREVPVWIVIEKAADLPGQWVAHCLDVDVVTYGNDPVHALKMVREAVEMVIVDDLDRGAEPTMRRAPEGEWARLRNMIAEGSTIDPAKMNELPADRSLLVNQMLRFDRRASIHLGGLGLPTPTHHPAWSPPQPAEPLAVVRVAC